MRNAYRVTKSISVFPVAAFLALSVSAGLANAADSAEPHKTYTVCISDDCAKSANYNYDCSFSRVHPRDMDTAAATDVCEFQNDYARFTYMRISQTPGGA